MKAPYLLAMSAAVAAVPVSAQADAQQRSVFDARNNFHGNLGSSRIANMPPACRNGCFSWERGHGFRTPRQARDERIFILEREVPVVVEREVVKGTPPPPAAVPLPQNSGGGEKARKPYVIGSSYASLPGGCMKMIEDGASYYFCGGGEWYRQVGKLYRAVKREL